MFRTHKSANGFTLIELLVVISIIGVLASVVLASLNSARARARDAVRRSDLKQLQLALESHFQDTGRYPINGGWTGYQASPCGSGSLSGPGGYIPGLAPTYIPQLPVDPGGQTGDCRGYLYWSNGQEYKLLSHLSPESTVPAGNPLHDPARPTWAWQTCSGATFCNY